MCLARLDICVVFSGDSRTRKAPASRPIFITDLRGRSYNFESVRIVKTDSGKLVFELEWDPRVSYLFAPTLSH